MTTIEPDIVRTWLTKMATRLKTVLADDLDDCMMVGIHSGGVVVARELHQMLGLKDPLGELNISFYRDDFSRIGLHPTVGASNLPGPVDGRTVVLVDDVIYSGRTIRAAMNEIFDYGRPARIILAVLVERDGHELPIRADVIGDAMDLHTGQVVKLQAGDLSLQISEHPDQSGEPA
ncbi:bifunctional pyr operon transcriptional regulator/uracil phosphoribosyltransferase PyrR [Granulosicoccaceae sp. 1_MG-2023]|nr:bifunctional pyr operon transcriptional regulator/uracil phosphoribosyltransferase PyrR [Granulosicoccaceae sp. 1_MG-2023]